MKHDIFPHFFIAMLIFQRSLSFTVTMPTRKCMKMANMLILQLLVFTHSAPDFVEPQSKTKGSDVTKGLTGPDYEFLIWLEYVMATSTSLPTFS